MKTFFAFAVAVWFTLSGIYAAERPNVVIILSDDMGYSDIGCFGGEIRTPTLDRLAAGGLRFTQFYNTARCCPTRASLLTGLYPHQAGMGHMTENRELPGYQGHLADRCVTIAEVLRSAGYRNYALGKWHVVRERDSFGEHKHNWPLQRGFDCYYGTLTGAGSFYDPTRLARDNEFITPVNDTAYQPKQFYYTDAISDQAVAFLRDHDDRHGDRPFFMYVAYTAAHWPMHALPEDIARYRGAYDDGYEPMRLRRMERMRDLGLLDPRWELTPQAKQWDEVTNRAWEARCMEVYAAMIDRMDQGIGKIVAQLEAQGALENTLVLYLQDNGGCAEGVGRQDNPKWHLPGIKPVAPDEMNPSVTPPMRTRDGRPVLGGPDVMPGPEDTYIAYGEGWANVSNTPFREYKHWVHEGGISTPLVAHWPQGIDAAQRGGFCNEPGHLIDIAATCIDLAGAEYPRQRGDTAVVPLQGISLRPALAGRTLDRPNPIFWEHEGNRAVRLGPWKLVAKGPAGAWELYDMTSDRSEMHNLAEEHPQRVQELAELWQSWAEQTYVLPWPWNEPHSP